MLYLDLRCRSCSSISLFRTSHQDLHSGFWSSISTLTSISPVQFQYFLVNIFMLSSTYICNPFPPISIHPQCNLISTIKIVSTPIPHVFSPQCSILHFILDAQYRLSISMPNLDPKSDISISMLNLDPKSYICHLPCPPSFQSTSTPKTPSSHHNPPSTLSTVILY